jgi:hypothetical protein
MWLAAATAWGLAEATLFFIVPDVLLSWLATFRPRVVWPAVLTCLLGALAGGVIMYLAAAHAPAELRALLDRVPAVSSALVAQTGAALQADYGAQMLRAGFTGVPYKILAVESAAQGRELAAFLAWSVPARLPRWLLLVLLARGVATVVRARKVRPERVLWALWAAGWGIVYVVYFSVMGW